MNQPTPFDLNPAIQRWRDNLGQSSAFRRENIDELEAHVRDSVAALQSQGLSAEEAFMLAAQRIGKGSSITAEFAKVNRQAVWLDRLLWVLVGSQLWLLAANVSNLIFAATNALLGAINRQLPVYGVAAVPDRLLSTAISQLAFPITLLLGVMLFWRIIRKWGTPIESALGKLFFHPTKLAAYYALLCLLVSCYQFLLGGVVMSLERLVNLKDAFTSPGYSGNSIVVLFAVHTLMLALFMHMVARKRLQIVKE